MAKEVDPRDYVAEFLAAGKTITVIPAGQRVNPENIVMKYMGGRGRSKNPTPPKTEDDTKK